MKKCEYCAKEISYHEMYCNSECEKNANDFYKMRNTISKIMGILNGVGVMSIGVGLFVFSFVREVGAFMVAVPLVVLGLLYILYPVPADVMIEKNKIKKAMKTTKIIGICIFAIGLIALAYAITLISI